MTEEFNNGIMNIIKMHSYYFYIVNRDQNIRCTCIAHETNEAEPDCQRCLGTGRKIIIKKIYGASQETKIPPTFKSDSYLLSRNYFIDNKYKVNEDDLIVDGEEIYKVFAFQNLMSLEGSLPYIKYNCVRKRFDSKVMMANFNKIIKSR